MRMLWVDRHSREILISVVRTEVVAVRRRQFRVCPKQFVNSPGNPSMFGLGGSRLEGNGFPGIFGY